MIVCVSPQIVRVMIHQYIIERPILYNIWDRARFHLVGSHLFTTKFFFAATLFMNSVSLWQASVFLNSLNKIQSSLHGV